MTWKMPEEPADSTDDVSVMRVGVAEMIIRNGDESLVLSDYSAAQLIAMLMMMLDMPIPRSMGKKILLGRRRREGEPESPGFTINVRIGARPIADPDAEMDAADAAAAREAIREQGDTPYAEAADVAKRLGLDDPEGTP